jgi:hypothetical protein
MFRSNRIANIDEVFALRLGFDLLPDFISHDEVQFRLEDDVIVTRLVVYRAHEGLGELRADDFLCFDQLVLVSARIEVAVSVADFIASSVVR